MGCPGTYQLEKGTWRWLDYDCGRCRAKRWKRHHHRPRIWACGHISGSETVAEHQYQLWRVWSCGHCVPPGARSS